MKAKTDSTSTVFIGSKIDIVDMCIGISCKVARVPTADSTGRYYTREPFNRIFPLLVSDEGSVEWVDEARD